MPKYRFVGDHPEEVYKGDKCVMMAPGEFIELSAEDMKRDENDGIALIPVSEKKEGGANK